MKTQTRRPVSTARRRLIASTGACAHRSHGTGALTGLPNLHRSHDQRPPMPGSAAQKIWRLRANSTRAYQQTQGSPHNPIAARKTDSAPMGSPRLSVALTPVNGAASVAVRPMSLTCVPFPKVLEPPRRRPTIKRRRPMMCLSCGVTGTNRHGNHPQTKGGWISAHFRNSGSIRTISYAA